MPFTLARRDGERLFIGVDANAENLCRYSGRAVRERLDNLLYVRATVERLPPELSQVADQVSVILPWGSLLAAVARPSIEVLRGVRALCRSGANLSWVFGHDPVRDRAELLRLGLPGIDDAARAPHFARDYARAGFGLGSVRAMTSSEVAALPSNWAKHLARGQDRRFLAITASAVA